MFAITGITGQVGGVVARRLLATGKDVRAVVRSAAKGAPWAGQDCEVALAEMDDAAALTQAFTGCAGVFILLPPIFDPDAELSTARAIARAVRQAIESAQPQKVVCLSTIGAQAKEFNLLTQLQLLERELAPLTMPSAFLRPAWYMENTTWDIAPAREGVVPSFLQPLDKPVPMVATADVGRVAAELLQENWSGRRVVELEGPARISPNEIATLLGRLLGREVRMQAVPRDTWEALFQSQGMHNPLPRMRMLDGFNEGWIKFEGDAAEVRKGEVELETVLRGLIERL
jgi:uncharacterized protein YbjT (DUF2867 family)